MSITDLSCWRQKSEVQVKASFGMDVTVLVAADWCPVRQAPPPPPVGSDETPGVSFLPPRWGFVSIFIGCFRFGPLYLRASLLPTTSALVYQLDMTFRRLKKVNSSGPETGPACQDSDIYFPSSKSDSCRTADFQSNCPEVYSYKTLAYSGGTLPRNLKKVTTHFQNRFPLYCKTWILIGYLMSLQMFSDVYVSTFVKLEHTHFLPNIQSRPLLLIDFCLFFFFK